MGGEGGRGEGGRGEGGRGEGGRGDGHCPGRKERSWRQRSDVPSSLQAPRHFHLGKLQRKRKLWIMNMTKMTKMSTMRTTTIKTRRRRAFKPRWIRMPRRNNKRRG